MFVACLLMSFLPNITLVFLLSCHISLSQCLLSPTSAVAIQAVPKLSKVKVAVLSTIIPITAHFPQTQNQTRDSSLQQNITRNLMVCFAQTSIHNNSIILTLLIALPCDVNGNFLPQHTSPPPYSAPDATEANCWHPFDDRLAFDWVHYHFTSTSQVYP